MNARACDYHYDRPSVRRCGRCQRWLCDACSLSPDDVTRCRADCAPLADSVKRVFQLAALNESRSLFGGRNSAALEARIVALDQAAEKPLPPEQVSKAFGREVAAALEGEGFKYVHSRRSLEREERGLVGAIILQTTNHNLAGVYVRCAPLLGLRSRAVGAWRRAHQVDWPGGDEVGVVGVSRAMLRWEPIEWDLAVRDLWQPMVEGTVTLVREVAVPWLAHFRDFLEEPFREPGTRVPGVTDYHIVEALLVLHGPEVAARYLADVALEPPSVRSDFMGSAEGQRLPGTIGGALFRFADRHGLSALVLGQIRS